MVLHFQPRCSSAAHCSQLLLSSSLTPEQQELAETVLESGNTLLGILGDILDFSKLDNGAIELHEEAMCLRSSVEACIEVGHKVRRA